MNSIRVSDDVKEQLRDLKRDDESFTDLLDQLSRTEKDVEEIVASLSVLDNGALEEEMQEVHDKLNESLRSRIKE